MRHVSRYHRVALDWPLDRINLDPKNQIKYVDTKNHLANILTKGSFARDECNDLCLFNIMSNSLVSCIHFSEIDDPRAMSKKADAGRKTRRRRRVRGCKIETCAESSVCESQSVSNGAEFEFISTPWESYSKWFNFGFIEYLESCRDGFE